MQNFFENKIVVQAGAAAIKAVLADPQKLLNWDPEIQTVTEAGRQSFRLVRAGSALNPTELITVDILADQVIYHSTAGRVAYDISFKLVPQQGQTLLIEQVALAQQTTSGLPLGLLRPIVKRAFMGNLANLAAFVERWAVPQAGERQ